MVDHVGHRVAVTRGGGRVGQMQDQLERLAGADLARTADDVVMGFVVEIARAEGRGIERVEELFDLLQLDLDQDGAALPPIAALAPARQLSTPWCGRRCWPAAGRP
jgi:hypothetical protein